MLILVKLQQLSQLILLAETELNTPITPKFTKINIPTELFGSVALSPDGKNLALHCFFLSLSHPVKDETMKWVARTPRSWSGRFGDEMEYIINSAIKRN